MVVSLSVEQNSVWTHRVTHPLVSQIKFPATGFVNGTTYLQYKAILTSAIYGGVWSGGSKMGVATISTWGIPDNSLRTQNIKEATRLYAPDSTAL